MKLASLKRGGRDGSLVVVSRDLTRAVEVRPIAATLQQALDNWSDVAPRLNAVAEALEAGKAQGELDAGLDVDAAAVLFIGTIQGLVMQSLLAGKVSRIRRDAPAVFAIYRRGIESNT